MMGENPMFLIDARFPGIDPDAGRRRCYFIPDSHHAIPFIIENQGEEFPRYVAPAHFDAVLGFSDDGVWESAVGGGHGYWSRFPSEWYVWLNRRSVRYTIRTQESANPAGTSTNPILIEHLDDIGGYEHASGYVSNHEAPGYDAGSWSYGQNGDGMGVPAYGLVSQITDKPGNRVEISYVEQRFSGCGHDSSENCQYCCQNCNEKGQINYIKLYAADESEAEWTLLYTYRAFNNDPTAGNIYLGAEYVWHRQQAVHQIHVYNRDITETSILEPMSGSRTIPYSHFKGIAETEGGGWYAAGARVNKSASDLLGALKTIEALSDAEVVGSITVPSDWVYAADYLYTDDTPIFQGLNGPNVTPLDYDPQEIFGANAADSLESPRLLKATVRHRAESTGPLSDHIVETHSVYRYNALPVDLTGGHGFGWNEGCNPYDSTYLRAMFDQTSIDAIRDGMEADGEPASTFEQWPMVLLTIDNDDIVSLPAPPTAPEPYEDIPFVDAATRAINRWGTYAPVSPALTYGSHASFDYSAFLGEMVDDYIKPELLQDEALTTLWDAAFVFSTRESAGEDGRHYKLYRFAIVPDGDSYSPLVSPGSTPVHTMLPPVHRALTQFPFMLHLGGSVGTLNSGFATDLGKVFWIAVIDEYDDAANLIVPSYQAIGTIANPDEEHEEKMPLTRRVVYMNRAGFVLKGPTVGYNIWCAH
jgi:hypothetical protein